MATPVPETSLIPEGDDRLIPYGPQLSSYNNCPSLHPNMPDPNRQLCQNVIEFLPNAPCPCADKTRQASVPGGRDDEMTGTDHDDDDDDDDDKTEFENELLPGYLSNGAEYNPISMMAEGWVHLKGSGKDWLGSRSWKARYIKLVLAEVDGVDYDVPLLLIYWFPQSETPSTVISLVSSIVVPLDKPDPTKWNAYQWSISSLSDETQATRTFTAPQKGRNAWVKLMNDAITASF